MALCGAKAYIYNNANDGTMLTVMKCPSSLDRLLSHNDDSLKNAFEEIKTLTAKERGEEPLPVDTQPSADEAHDNIDFLVAIQSNSLSASDLVKISEESSDIVKEHQEMASKLVATLCRLINSNLSDKEMLHQLRTSHIGRLNTDELNGMMVMFYDVKASGEDAKRPAHRRATLRKGHLDRMMQLVLSSRTPAESADKLTAIKPKEAILIFDAGREGNTSGLLSSIRIGDQALLCMLVFHWCTFHEVAMVAMTPAVRAVTTMHARLGRQ